MQEDMIMAKNITAKSVEPQIADMVNGWLKSYDMEYNLDTNDILICAIQKLVIKDVVVYRERKMAAAKIVLGREKEADK